MAKIEWQSERRVWQREKEIRNEKGVLGGQQKKGRDAGEMRANINYQKQQQLVASWDLNPVSGLQEVFVCVLMCKVFFVTSCWLGSDRQSFFADS